MTNLTTTRCMDVDEDELEAPAVCKVVNIGTVLPAGTMYAALTGTFLGEC